MKTSHWEEKTAKVEVIDDIICNQCGCTLKNPHSPNFEGLVETVVEGGYASKLGDLTRFVFSICEGCLIQMFKSFKHPPKTL